MTFKRTSPRKKAKEILKHFRKEKPDYTYLKSVFKHLRDELEIDVPQPSKKLPYVPSEAEMKKFYEAAWESQNFQDMMIIKTLLYTGVRVGELVNIQLSEVDLKQCQIRINQGKGKKDRIVPFPPKFKELIAMHIANMKQKQAKYLFESSWSKKYTDRGIRKLLSRYSQKAGLEKNISPHTFRHFFLTWLKKQGLDDALIQPYSGHESRQSLEIYSKLSLSQVQNDYNNVMEKFPL